MCCREDGEANMRRNDLFRKLSVDSITAGSGRKHGLKRSLGAFELMMLGVGVIIGSGLFVITGVAASFVFTLDILYLSQSFILYSMTISLVIYPFDDILRISPIKADISLRY